MIRIVEDLRRPARIKVAGVGGGGCNAINTMIQAGLEGVDFVAANTDVQCLENHLAQFKVQLGPTLTKGLGAGANPEIGRQAALEVQEAIGEAVGEADMVFVTAGMGGGTGTGAAPILANVARSMGILTVGVVTKPFDFEGKRRMRQATEGIAELKDAVDTLIIIPNQRLLSIADEAMPLLVAFKKVDEVLLNAVQGVSDLINVNGLVNLDFADVKAIMSNQGLALMGTGRGSGAKKATEAARAAVTSPLLDDIEIDGATGVLMNITGGLDLSLRDVDDACSCIREAAHPDANIIFGAVIDERLKDEFKITVIATGFDRSQQARREVIARAGGENRDRPTYIRMKKSEVRAAAAPQEVKEEEKFARILKELSGAGVEAENEYDIPTYLRKTNEGGSP
ncbi:MAG: cell division protein FtsZ [Deltaproteobacteria bacterium]|nr:cell division protein FtsZ [Deltaproteobacteria bacterium]